jgi:hypothetical protein
MLTNVSEMRTASIALMMEAIRTSETLVSINSTTRQYIPEDSKLHTRRRENLKSHASKEVGLAVNPKIESRLNPVNA